MTRDRERHDRSALFLTPCFLAHRLHKHIRGVEVFDIELVRGLVRAGVRLTVAAEASWKGRFERLLDGAMPEFLYTPPLRKPLWNGLALAPRLLGRRYDALILGNVSNGLGPIARLARRRCGRTVLIAHRHPRAAFLRAIRGAPVDVIAVNDAIGAAFGPPHRVTVRYGLPNADLFHPGPPRGHDGVTRFAMVGRLDTPLKRVDLVLAALADLPPDLRARCELHLLSYPQPPADLPPGVVAYPWMPVEQVAQTLRSMDVLVVASESETWSQALVQGMLTGLAGLVRNLPALVEKVDRGEGLVFSTPAELRDAMARMAADPEATRAMGRAALRTARERYVWDHGWFIRDHLFPPA